MSRLDPEFQQSLDMLSDSLSAFLRDNWDFNARREAIKSSSGWSASLWSSLCSELGLLGAAEDETLGGMGLGLASQGQIARVLGQNLTLTPYLESAVIGAALMRHGGPAADHALQLAIQGTIYAPALYEPHSRYNAHAVASVASSSGQDWHISGHKRLVRCAPWAAALIVSARTANGLSLFIVDPKALGVRLSPIALHDGQMAAEIQLSEVRGTLIHSEGKASPVITRAINEGTYALCAEAVGVMTRLTDATLDYVRQRKQFGLPIGTFQTLQFRLADMAMALEEAEAILAPTLAALQSDDNELASRAVSAAKLTIDRACETVSCGAVQLHGAIGLTDELDVSHAFKRALMIQHELGDSHTHADRPIAA